MSQGRYESSELTAVSRRYLDAFSAANIDGMRALLVEDMVAYITNGSGGMDEVRGRDTCLARIAALDLPSAQFSVNLTQPPVVVSPDQVLIMIEIRAERRGRFLHNFAAHLLRITNEQITDRWMVDAKPAGSDKFWS
jgi:ketosteroid isomerase-like protein